MYPLSNKDVMHISGGSDYQDWQVIAISGVSTGLAVATFTALKNWSVLTSAKYFIACSIPPTIVSALIVGSFSAWEWYFEGS